MSLHSSYTLAPGNPTRTNKNALQELTAPHNNADKVKDSSIPLSPPPANSPDQGSFEGLDRIQNDWLKRLIDKEWDMGSERSSQTQDSDKEIALPDKKGIHGGRWLRYKGLATYRKLFVFIFFVNLVVFIAMVTRCSGGLPMDQIATAVAANLLVAVLFRQEHFVNFVFWLATRWPHSTPLWIRIHSARCYHLGGFHSGAAVAATHWWVIFAAQSTKYFAEDNQLCRINAPTVCLTFTILALLILILAMSHPSVRTKMHDQYEWTHRFAGWTVLLLVWAHIVVSTASRKPAATPLGPAVLRSPPTWLVALTTLSVALPWLRLRRVAVVAEPLSPHAVRLHFDFCTPPPGKAVRLSDRPLREWHAFATIAEPGPRPGGGPGGFSVLVSRAGDWTGRLIEQPPQARTGGRARAATLWTRGVPASGVLRVAPLFRRIVLVATGSGIGPCLPVLFQQQVACRVLWAAPSHEATFGARLVAGVRAAAPDAVLWNTRERGRPDLAREAFRLYRGSGAECVMVVSNGPVTEKLVYDLEKRGIPAFGPIVDS